MPSFVTHLSCGLTGEIYPKGEIHGLSKAGRPLLVHYDLDAIRTVVTREDMQKRAGGFWKWRELLPVEQDADVVSLGEVDTPLIPLRCVGQHLNLPHPEWLVTKDEGRLPTGSFKARGLALAVSMAKSFGIRRMAIPTNGNAGAALAAYATSAGIESFCFCPADTPLANVTEMSAQGARVFRVNGLINDCGKIVGAGKETMGWFDTSTLKEPYRIEGKKTMGLELALQYAWDLPDVIFYPTGGGTGLIGMWKAFQELEALGWIAPGRRPRLVAVQAAGCAPIVKAFDAGERHAPLWQNAQTLASGIRVPVAVGDFLILDAVRQSGGWACAVSDDDIVAARDLAGRLDGVLLCPEGAATLAAYQQGLATGQVGRDARVVLFNCGSGLKYDLPDRAGRIDHLDIDWQMIAAMNT